MSVVWLCRFGRFGRFVVWFDCGFDLAVGCLVLVGLLFGLLVGLSWLFVDWFGRFGRFDVWFACGVVLIDCCSVWSVWSVCCLV